MKKRILAIFAMSFLMLPLALQAAAVSAPADFIPDTAAVTFDFHMAGKLKTFMEPLIAQELKKAKGEEDYEKIALLADKLIAGEHFEIHFAIPQSLYASFPASDDEWKTLTNGMTKYKSPEYPNAEIYADADANMSLAKIGGFAVIASTPADLEKAVSLAEGKTTDSLANSAGYKNLVDSLLQSRFAGLAVIAKPILDYVDKNLAADAGDNIASVVKQLIALINSLAVSVGETGTGYQFNIAINGNPEELKKNELSFNPGGSFIPNLYKKFPNAKPIYYTEAFNPKADYEQSVKFWKKLLGKISTELGPDAEKADINVMNAEIKKQLGFDFADVYGLFDKELAFAIQYDSDSQLPYFTLIGNASNTKAAAEKLTADVKTLINDFLKENEAPKDALLIEDKNGFFKATVDLTKIEGYDGPPIGKIMLVLGVTEDGLFIFSNYPNIEEASVRSGFTGLASDPDFSSFTEINQELSGLAYVNARNVWSWFDNLLKWLDEVGDAKHAPPLDFYQGYYSVLEKIYGWRDLLVTATSTESASLLNGKITMDNKKHATYKKLLKNMQKTDRDDDGVSDYDEQYVYFTPVNTADSDNDGVNDIEALKKGLNPAGGGRLFKDVGEDTYYTDETAFLYQRGAIKGYGDGTFQPGKLVNRAEFTTMVVKAFEQSASDIIGVDLTLGGGDFVPFADVSHDEWYYAPIAKAYGAGLISGSENPETGEMLFRPGDNITRAEAIAILNKASYALKKTRPKASCANSAFKDVPEDAWFCEAVANAYSNGVTKGKTEGAFKPFDKLTRAEAAVMIKRTLEIDVQEQAKGTESVKELTAPISGEFMPVFGGIMGGGLR